MIYSKGEVGVNIGCAVLNMKEKLKIAVIDSSPTDSADTAVLLKQYFQQALPMNPHEIISYKNGRKFLHSYTKNLFHLIFLEFFLDDMSGLEAAQKIRSIDASVIIIFITSSKEFAIDCYQVHAFDYLIKPLSYQQIHQSLSLIRFDQLQNQPSIHIPCGKKQFCLQANDIVYCDASGHYVQIHTKHSMILRTRISFGKFVQTLKPYSQFLFCYRGCLVNMNHIIHVEDMSFVMLGNDRIPIRLNECASIKKHYYDYLSHPPGKTFLLS